MCHLGIREELTGLLRGLPKKWVPWSGERASGIPHAGNTYCNKRLVTVVAVSGTFIRENVKPVRVHRYDNIY